MSFAASSPSDFPSKPGVLYVNSKIKGNLDAELFTKWYNEVHIPDNFQTGGIKSAFRYKANLGDDVERPYLALYPLQDMSFLGTAEFKSIPVKSDILPGSGEIFDSADFDTRYYELLSGWTDEETVQSGPAPYILTLQFSTSAPESKVKEWFQHAMSTAKPLKQRLRLLKLIFARQNRLPPEESELGERPKYLILDECSEINDLQEAMKSWEEHEKGKDWTDVRHATFGLLQEFHAGK